MKIVVSGSAGTGKSTLVNKISPFLPNHIVLGDYTDEYLRERGFRTPKDLDQESAHRIRLKALQRKIYEGNRTPNFVSEKGAIDYLAYWISWTMNGLTDSQKHEFFDLARKHAQSQDLVVLLDFQHHRITENGIRNTDWFNQFKIDLLIKSLYTEFGVQYTPYRFDINDSGDKIIRDLGIK